VGWLRNLLFSPAMLEHESNITIKDRIIKSSRRNFELADGWTGQLPAQAGIFGNFRRKKLFVWGSLQGDWSDLAQEFVSASLFERAVMAATHRPHRTDRLGRRKRGFRVKPPGVALAPAAWRTLGQIP
jgi:hypothetical protein